MAIGFESNRSKITKYDSYIGQEVRLVLSGGNYTQLGVVSHISKRNNEMELSPFVSNRSTLLGAKYGIEEKIPLTVSLPAIIMIEPLPKGHLETFVKEAEEEERRKEERRKK